MRLGALRPRDRDAKDVHAGRQPVAVTWLTITDAWRRALAVWEGARLLSVN
jgi:hypothetical protein